MESAVIIYGSVTGLTEEIAFALSREIAGKYDTQVIDAIDFDPELVESADLLVLGSSTWGVGELQIDMIPVYEALSVMDLQNKKAAVFGVGDSAYRHYCRAVTTLERALQEAGAQLVQRGYRCNKVFDEKAQSKLSNWALAL